MLIARRRESLSDLIAPPAHTAALIVLILAVAGTGLLLQSQSAVPKVGSPGSSRIIAQYAPLLCANLALVLYVCRLFRARNVLPDLLGAGWHSARQAGLDLAGAALAFLTIESVAALAVRHSGMGRNAALSALLPSTVAERLSWLLVALWVGFSEEVVYRGYLQTQLFAFTGRASTAVVLQALLFGVAHVDQGLASAARIALYGLVLGLLARIRGSLLPAIACHAAIDIVGGLMG